jgi:ADP-heptose:LPS heptosyltransferase
MTIKSIILSRTDSLGDVVLSLPVAGAIKRQNARIKVLFIGRTYSKSIIEASEFVDQFINFDELLEKSKSEQISFFRNLNADAIVHVFPQKEIARLAKLSNIPIRIGTSHRIFHILTCNRRVNIGRKNSNLHESQLNLKLLKPLQFKSDYSLEEVSDLYGFNKYVELDEKLSSLISANHFNLILHPKSKGSAREWGLKNFSELIELLPQDSFKIFVTGTKEEGSLMSDFLEKHKLRITDLTGSLNLSELLSFISKVDGLVAASTGPLHIAAATGIRAIGIFAPMRPIHPQRWMPIGKKADFLVLKKVCNDCKHGGACKCILSITPNQVYQKLINKTC